MKKNLIFLLVAAVIVSSCDTYAGAGAYAGSQVGGMLGSFIGGISGGYRGSDVGGLVGMAGGAIIGAAVGSAADQQQKQAREEAAAHRQRRYNQRNNNQDYGNYQNHNHQMPDYSDGNYLDETNSGDDRIDFIPSDRHVPNNSNYSVDIRRIHFIDGVGHDQTLSAGELAKVSIEMFNLQPYDIYNVQAVVEDASGNKHVQLSSPVCVERIASGKGVRYTAMVRASKRLKTGTLTLKAYAMQNGKQVSKTERIVVPTKK